MPDLARAVSGLRLQAPKLRYVSSLTGTWIRPEEATDPAYWARQMRQPVRFAAGLEVLLADGCAPCWRWDPARRSPRWPGARACAGQADDLGAVAAPRGPSESDHAGLLRSLGELWSAGVEVDWSRFHAAGCASASRCPRTPSRRSPAASRRRPRCPGDWSPCSAAPVAPAPVAAQAPAGTPAPAPVAAARERDRAARHGDLARAPGHGGDRPGRRLPGAGRQLADGGADAHPPARDVQRAASRSARSSMRPPWRESPRTSRPCSRRPSPPGPWRPRPSVGSAALASCRSRSSRSASGAGAREPGNPALNMPLAIRISGALDGGAAGAERREIVRRHEMLRANYTWWMGACVQSFAPS